MLVKWLISRLLKIVFISDADKGKENNRHGIIAVNAVAAVDSSLEYA